MENNNYVPEIYIGENGNWFINGGDTGIHAQGEKGKDGITPHISEDGYWCIGDIKTTVRAKGHDGYTPYINTDGYWCIGDMCSGVKAFGEQGTKGDAGPQGTPGPKGEQGVPGEQGAQGPKGDKGTPGDKGIQGPIGPEGPQGLTGATGPQGTTGPKGDTGAQGPRGDTGLAGPQGIQGPAGAPGTNGVSGPQGAKGDTGERGPQGIQGVQGVQGPKGATGSQGPAGPVNIANNLTTTATGYALDARQGKLLSGRIDVSERNINSLLNRSDSYCQLLNGHYGYGNGQWGQWNQGNNVLVKKGNVVMLFIQLIVGANQDSITSIATIPAGYRPVMDVAQMVPCQGDASKIVQFNYVPTGQIVIYDKVLKGESYFLAVTYIV